MNRSRKFTALVSQSVLLILVASKAMSVERSVESEGYCGFLAAKLCATQLGVNWGANFATKKLEANDVAEFTELQQALDSLGLNTHFTIVDQPSRSPKPARFAFSVRRLGWTMVLTNYGDGL